jgi:hypothetical protein
LKFKDVIIHPAEKLIEAAKTNADGVPREYCMSLDAGIGIALAGWYTVRSNYGSLTDALGTQPSARYLNHGHYN